MLRNLKVTPATESWSELLDWVNRTMPLEAPNHNKVPTMRKVEECGHGVPYVLLLPTMLPIIHTPLLTSRVKVPAKTDYEAVANLKIMQDALRRNGIDIPDVLINGQQKLISGNFQANLQLLQWFRGLCMALQQCGIEAGEGRIILAPPSNEDSVKSLGIPPEYVVRAEEHRRAESIHRNKPNTEVLCEVRAADSQGDAAAAAAVALLSEQRARSQHRSQSRNSQFEASVSNSSHSALLPVHHQQVLVVSQQRKPQRRHASVGCSRPEESESEPPASSPPPALPLTESSLVAPIPPPPLPQLAAKQAKKAAPPARTSSRLHKFVEHPANLTQLKEPWARPVAESTEVHADPMETTKSAPALNVVLHCRSSVQHRPSSPDARKTINSTTAVNPNSANGGRTPRRAASTASNTRTRMPTTGPSGLVFKPIPARLSINSCMNWRTSEKSGGSPQGRVTASGNTQNGLGSRRASGPKRPAAASGDRGAAPQPGSIKPSKRGAKPVIVLSSVVPATQTSCKTQKTSSAPAPIQASAPIHTLVTPTVAAVPSTISNDAALFKPGTTATPSSGQQPSDLDVFQLQIDRQFFYDKLRAIEELVDCMEAKKRQERNANAKTWDDKDEEMMDFTNSVRNVLYAES